MFLVSDILSLLNINLFPKQALVPQLFLSRIKHSKCCNPSQFRTPPSHPSHESLPIENQAHWTWLASQWLHTAQSSLVRSIGLHAHPIMNHMVSTRPSVASSKPKPKANSSTQSVTKVTQMALTATLTTRSVKSTLETLSADLKMTLPC